MVAVSLCVVIYPGGTDGVHVILNGFITSVAVDLGPGLVVVGYGLGGH